jgi:hypothetical protein
MATGKNRFGDIISKCWQDAAFKQRFLTDPKAVLAEFEIEVPAGLNVKVVENTDDTLFLTIPPKPVRGELSDKDLEGVSGGAGGTVARPNQILRPGVVSSITPTLIHTAAGNTTCDSHSKDCVPW